MLTEKPRGKTILTWFQRFPRQDAIHVYDPLLGDIIMPMSPQALRDVLSTHSMDFEKPEGCNTLLATVGGRHGHNMTIIAIYCNTPIYCNLNNMRVGSLVTI